MQKIIVIGCPGAGKSTFSRELRDKLKLPLYYLDMIWHKPDKTTITCEEFDRKLSEILETDKWIIDGNYNRTLEMRFKACDTVFFLDFEKKVCLSGARERVGKPREDMPWVEEKTDEELEKFIEDFSTAARPRICSMTKKYKDKNIIILKTRDESQKYLRSIVYHGESQNNCKR